MVSRIFDLQGKNTICGDFNINLLENSFYKNKIVNLFNENSLKQFITEPTRITQNSATLIDYVLCNTLIETKVINNDIVADHATLLFGKQNDDVTDDNKMKQIRKIMNYTQENLIGKLNKYW